MRLYAAKAMFGLKRTDKAIQTVQVILSETGLPNSIIEDSRMLLCDCLLRNKDFSQIESYCAGVLFLLII